MAARYGGEEFVILHPAVDSQDAFRVAERIRKAVESTPYLHEREEIGVTLSAGVVDTKHRMNCSRIDDVLALADIALYQAKDAGRNQVIIYES
jgi:diguanylate cyclase